jgi:hypothetical protein
MPSPPLLGALATLCLLLPVSSASGQTVASKSSDYLFAWSGSLDSTAPDFLAVLDVRDDGTGDRYGRLVTTLAVPGRGNRPHHTEHDMPADGQLFANGFGSGQTFIFDLTHPTAPRIARQFGDVGALMHPHSFWRLPNGHLLATFQMQHDSLGVAPGGLVEMGADGTVIRSASADLAGVDRRIRPYSAAILPGMDRVVVSTTDMNPPDSTNAVQIWRLSDLSLQATINLPAGPRGDEGYLSAEPRLLPDGKRVLVSTFNCGLYLVDNITSAAPTARLVASFPRTGTTHCAVPVIVGHFYLVTVPAWNAVVSLDIADPLHPREVSRLVLGGDDVPHWIGVEPDHRRVVITGYKALRTRILLARFDPESGRLALDERFRMAGSDEVGFRMEQVAWPHGGSAAASPHGAVFSRP